MLLLPVLASKKSLAWPKSDTGARAQYLAAVDVFSRPFETDAHFAAYSVPTLERRLDSGAPARLADGVPMVALVLDPDSGAAHRGDGTAAELARWRDVERAKVRRLLDAHPGGFVYETRGGYRIVYTLPAPFVIRTDADRIAWQRIYLRSALYLARAFGIVPDPTCKDWTRLYRVPRATRDGALEDRPTTGDPAAIGPWTYAPVNDVSEDLATALDLAEAEEAITGARSKVWRSVLRDLEPPAPAPAANPRATAIPADMKSRRIRAWLANRDPAINGSGGHATTMKVVVGVVVGFDTTEDEAFEHLQEWNARCQPPWSPAELRHKIHDAATRSRKPRGYILDEDRGRRVRDTATDADAAAYRAAHARATGSEMTPSEHGATGECTDLRNAERMVEWYGADLRFVATWEKWAIWDGRRFEIDRTNAAMRYATRTARRLLSIALDELKGASEDVASAQGDEQAEAKAQRRLARARALHAWALKSQSAPRLNAMISLAQADARIVVAHTNLDADPWALNCANGTINLRTGRLRSHRREDLITKLSPVDFDPMATAPTWLAFLDRVMGGDAELVAFLQRAAGYSLTASIQEHALFFLFGGGANGKSTFLTVLHAMLGDNATPAPRGLLFSKNGEQHPTELATLCGARFVTCSEIGEGQSFDEAKLKDLTGGDVIECRRMREDFWSFLPTHKLWIAGNHKPRVRGNDEGIWRRIRLVPWTVQIPAEERDKRLPEKLRAELPGILAWAVRGCIEWQRMELGEPLQVREATEAYRDEEDPLAEFFDLWCVFEPDAKVARAALRRAYDAYAEENGIRRPLSPRDFAKRLKARGVDDGGTVRVPQSVSPVDAWRGIRLATEEERVGRRGNAGTRSGMTGNSNSHVGIQPESGHYNHPTPLQSHAVRRRAAEIRTEIPEMTEADAIALAAEELARTGGAAA